MTATPHRAPCRLAGGRSLSGRGARTASPGRAAEPTHDRCPGGAVAKVGFAGGAGPAAVFEPPMRAGMRSARALC